MPRAYAHTRERARARERERGRGNRLSLTISATPVGVGAASHPWILTGEQSLFQTDTATMESVLLCERMKSRRRFMELESAIRGLSPSHL
jgi:hypothetical protein